jgi:thiol-disulfide isomerase/thioredoxin
MKTLSILLTFCTLTIGAYSQTMHNFTVTDSGGNIHRLYEDYLDQGKTVVLKFFFTTCPPCNAIAPQWQQKYVAWGSGLHDVQFIEPTTITSDNNSKVSAYKTMHGLTLPSISHEGNAPAIVDPFKAGTYGGWFGTPSFVVIAPNKSIQFPVSFSNLDAAIAATGAQMPGSGPVPITVNLSINTNNYTVGADHVKFYLRSANTTQPKYEIKKNGQGQYSLKYPSTDFPVITAPEVYMESNAADLQAGITSFDLVQIQKHILGITPFTSEANRIAADVTLDDRITAFDLVTLRKLILGIIVDFPAPSYRSIPDKISINALQGATQTFNFTIVKIGNIN